LRWSLRSGHGADVRSRADPLRRRRVRAGRGRLAPYLVFLEEGSVDGILALGTARITLSPGADARRSCSSAAARCDRPLRRTDDARDSRSRLTPRSGMRPASP
jgi:hypothetical protein